MAEEFKTVFNKDHPDVEPKSLNHLNQTYMIAYLKHQIDIGNKEKVAKYAAETQGKSLKEKKRNFALTFFPDLLKDNKKTFEEKLANLLN